MAIIRQMIQKGDPILRIQLPTTTLQILETSAKKNKRRPQDQFIKILAETFKNDCDSILEKYLPDVKAVYEKQQ